MKHIRLVVVSGPSGSGKSTAINVLEDIGFYCMDNLPAALLPTALELIGRTGEITRVAVVVDVRERGFLDDFPSVYAAIKRDGHDVELVYFDASDDVLARRFSETRRKHPLAETESPIEGIKTERKILSEIGALADRVVDTTAFNVHELKDYVRGCFEGPGGREKLVLNFVSFGFRYGIPPDADIVIDVRFLPNPYFEEALAGLDGRDAAVSDFVLEIDETRKFLERFGALIEYLLPLYSKEGKYYLTIAVGCTGGRHRSVVIAQRLATQIKNNIVTVRTRHRDIDKQ